MTHLRYLKDEVDCRFEPWSCLTKSRYDNVTLIPLVLQLGLRIGPIQCMGAN